MGVGRFLDGDPNVATKRFIPESFQLLLSPGEVSDADANTSSGFLESGPIYRRYFVVFFCLLPPEVVCAVPKSPILICTRQYTGNTKRGTPQDTAKNLFMCSKFQQYSVALSGWVSFAARTFCDSIYYSRDVKLAPLLLCVALNSNVYLIIQRPTLMTQSSIYIF